MPLGHSKCRKLQPLWELGWTGAGCCCRYGASVDTNTSLKPAPPERTSQLVLVVKNPIQSKKAMQEMQKMWVQSLGLEDPLEKEMAIPFSILSWKISCTEEPSELQSMGPQRVRHDWANEHTPGKVYQLLYFVIIWGLRSWGKKRIYPEKANLGLFHVASGHNSKCEKVKNRDIMIMASYVQMHTFYWFYSIIVIITLNADLLTLCPKTLLSCRNPNNILDLFLYHLYNISNIGNNTYTWMKATNRSCNTSSQNHLKSYFAGYLCLRVVR